MDKIKDMKLAGSREQRAGVREAVGSGDDSVYCFMFFDPCSMLRAFCVLCLVSCLGGCAATPKKVISPVDQQFQAVAVDVYQNPESRAAAQKILGVNADQPVIKYSPVTGKHYSGDLEFDPETGAKLEVVKE